MCYTWLMALRRPRLIPILVASLFACASFALPELSALQVRSAQASVSVQLPLAQLARTASRILVGTTIESHSVWEDEEGGARRIVTYHRVRVERQATDATSGDVWVRCLGGTVDGIGQRVEGAAILRNGQRALLFLVPRDDGTFSVLGMAQGVYPIQRGVDGVDRLLMPRSPGVIVPADRIIAAVTVLPGKTVDEAFALVREARQAHAQ